jgi:undecaprenyl-diphosphatase
LVPLSNKYWKFEQIGRLDKEVMDWSRQMDEGAYAFFHHQAKTAAFLNPLMEAGDWIGSYLGAAILLLAALALTPRPWRPRLALAVLAAFLAGAALVEGVKLAVARPRPADAEDVLGAAALSPSFPSRAVFLAAFACMILAIALERGARRPGCRFVIRLTAGLVVVFVCVSQLWLSLHFVTDVLAGLAGGLGLALAARWAATPPTP